jgi:Spx/MgsR family transcriptional regulator
MITLYGIKNCDTVRKARRWLDDRRLEYRFHDLRADGLGPDLIDRWMQSLEWEQLVNRRGTTWRKLPEKQRAGLDAAKAREIMLANPAIIKRPVVDTGSGFHVGFSDERFTRLFSDCRP